MQPRAASALVIERVEEADPTDAEWIATLLRRIDPALVQIVVCTGAELPDGALAEALRRYADRRPGVAAPPLRADAAARPPPRARAAARSRRRRALRRRRVHRRAVCGPPTTRFGAAERAALHDARADELERRDELSLTLGAIPYHRERGADPRGAGAQAVLAALQHCMLSGYYDAVLDLAHRSYALLDWATQPEECWRVTSKLTMALAAMGRPDEAAELYDHACVQTTLPKIHLHAAYGRAMLNTRFYSAERRDRVKAKAWINTAIALSSQLPDAQRRAFDLSFNENGLALIETYLGDPEKALALVEQGIERVDAELDDERLLLHRSVLRYNRAQLLSRMGRPEQALAAYGEAIEADPNQSEYYFERGNLLRRLGRAEQALGRLRRGDPHQPAVSRAPPGARRSRARARRRAGRVRELLVRARARPGHHRRPRRPREPAARRRRASTPPAATSWPAWPSIPRAPSCTRCTPRSRSRSSATRRRTTPTPRRCAAIPRSPPPGATARPCGTSRARSTVPSRT